MIGTSVSSVLATLRTYCRDCTSSNCLTVCTRPLQCDLTAQHQSEAPVSTWGKPARLGFISRNNRFKIKWYKILDDTVESGTWLSKFRWDILLPLSSTQINPEKGDKRCIESTRYLSQISTMSWTIKTKSNFSQAWKTQILHKWMFRGYLMPPSSAYISI
jgi:hypothetical protein